MSPDLTGLFHVHFTYANHVNCLLYVTSWVRCVSGTGCGRSPRAITRQISVYGSDKLSTAEQAYEFERRVAAIYRALGARVKHDIALAGNQIDILLEEGTTTGALIRSAVECRFHSRQIGIGSVNAFGSIVDLLRSRNLIERGVIVSHSGFTRSARDAANQYGIDLVEFADLERQASGRESEVAAIESELAFKSEIIVERLPIRAFVVIPFSKEYDDLYVLGIRDVAESLGIVAERADEIQHNDSIPELIRERIKRSDVIIAETTAHNPNVFYEVGLAHGMGRPTVLICKDASSIPFDLAAINHVVYRSISDLKNLLTLRLKATLRLNIK